MNDNTFKFLDEEIRLAGLEGSPSRQRQLKAVRGYLVAAKELRDKTERAGHVASDRWVYDFDRECARVSP